MIKALIFDCFGVVLTDALKVLAEKLSATDPAKADQMLDIMKASMHGIILSGEADQRRAALLGMNVEQYRINIRQGEVKDQALLDYIGELHQTYKTAMLSNVSSGGLARRFKAGELEQYFDVIVASSEIGFAKPEPEAYETVAERLGVRLEDCLMIDDRELYCDGARAVGMQALLYTDLTNFKKAFAALR